MAALTTTRAIARFDTDTTRVRDVSEDMILREPDASHLFVLTAGAKRKKPSDDPKFQWFEDQEVTFWGNASSAGNIGSTITAIPVADGTIFAVGDVVVVPAAVSATSEECLLVTAVSTNTLTVTRGLNSSADTINGTGSLRIIGSSLAEDSAIPTQRYQAQTAKTSYCQIFRTPVKITHTAASTKKYGGPDRVYQLKKALIRHRSEIEAVGLWSRATESLSGSASQWTSMGLKQIISTNKTSGNTTLTQTIFNNFSETAFRYGQQDQKLLLASPKIMSAINNFAIGKLNAYTGDNAYGVQLTSYLAPLGEYLLKNNYRFAASEAGSGLNGYEDEAIAVDIPSVGLRYLDGGSSLIGDTKLFQDVLQDGSTVRVDEYRSQIGWEFRHEIKHSLLYNVTAYS